MEKPTEHQPLDDFFRRKLRESSVQPSAGAWERLQSKMQRSDTHAAEKNHRSRRLGVLWPWMLSSTAACLVFVMVWTKQTHKETAFQAKTAPLESRTAETQQNPNRPALAERDSFSSSSPIQVIPVVAATKKTQRSKLHNVGIKPGEQTEQPQVTLQAKASTDTEEFVARVPPQPDFTEPPQNGTTGTALEEVANIEAAVPKPAHARPERTLIVRVAEPIETRVALEDEAEQTEAFSKPTRAGRVWQQIKRIKNGEAMARAEEHTTGMDDDSGLFNRLIRSARSRDSQHKSQK